MRRSLMCALVSVTALVLVPGGAMARQHHQKRHHRHHVRVHRERFGTVSGPLDSPGSTPSSESVGKIASFDGTTLTIMLADGSSVSGAVTGDTAIECSSMASGQVQSDDQGGGSGSGSGSGSGDQGGAGNDQGGDNGDQGDDNGNDQGDNNGNDQGDGNGNDGGQNCSTADLMPNTTVTGAELRISRDGRVWDQVELQLP